MVQTKDYVAGWLNTSICDFLQELPRNSKSAVFALITCLDSNPNPKPSLLDAIVRQPGVNGAKTLKKNLLLPTKLLMEEGVCDRLFYGFDEIWFFPNDRIEPKPKTPSIVGPRRIDQAKLNRLSQWMNRNHCSLALGDGDGMNIIVKAKGLAGKLLAHSMVQPEPTLQLSDFVKQDELETSNV